MHTALRSNAIIPLLLINFVSALGFMITLPLMPYYAATFNADAIMVGLLSAVYAICAFVAGPILGRLSDRQGRRPWLLFSQLGTVIGFILTAIGGSIGMLFLGRIIDGISGGNQVIAQAYVGDVTEPQQRTRVYGLMGASFGLGAVIGPVLGGLLSQINYAAPFWAAAGISLVSLILTALFLPEPDRSNRPVATANTSLRTTISLAIQPKIRRPLAIFGIMALVMGMFVSSIGLFMQLQLKSPPLVAALSVAYYGVLTVLVQIFVVGRLSRRFGEQRLLPVGLIALVIAMVILYLASSTANTLAAVTFLVFGMALLRPALMSLISQAADPNQQGSVMGLGQSLESISQIIAPVLSGWLIASIAPAAPWPVAAIFALIGLVVVLVFPQPEAHVQETMPVANSETRTGELSS